MNSIYKKMDKIDDNKSLNEKWNVKNQRELKKLKESLYNDEDDYYDDDDYVEEEEWNWDGLKDDIDVNMSDVRLNGKKPFEYHTEVIDDDHIHIIIYIENDDGKTLTRYEADLVDMYAVPEYSSGVVRYIEDLPWEQTGIEPIDESLAEDARVTAKSMLNEKSSERILKALELETENNTASTGKSLPNKEAETDVIKISKAERNKLRPSETTIIRLGGGVFEVDESSTLTADDVRKKYGLTIPGSAAHNAKKLVNQMREGNAYNGFIICIVNKEMWLFEKRLEGFTAFRNIDGMENEQIISYIETQNKKSYNI